MVLGREPIGEISLEDVETMMNTNVTGLIELTNIYAAKFRAKNKGDIVMLGSIAGRDPYPGGAIYCATKAALNSFTHILRKETVDTRIRVIEVQPGAVETEFSSKLTSCIAISDFSNNSCAYERRR
jgi:NADP-dependent 3-hydroxy acid dehydrogenase YdfG